MLPGKRLIGFFRSLVEQVEARAVDGDARRRGTLVLVFCAATLVGGVVLGGTNIATGARAHGYFMIAMAALTATIPTLLATRGCIAAAANALTLSWAIVVTVTLYERGGITSSTASASAVIPLFAVVLVGARAGVWWLVAMFAMLGGFLVASALGVDLHDNVPVASRARVSGIAAMVLSSTVLAIALAHEHLKNEALRAHRSAEGRLRALLAGLPDQVFRLDRHGRFLDYHATADQEGAKLASGLLGKPVSALFPKDASTAEQAIDDALESGQPQRYEFSRELDGALRHFEVRVSPRGTTEVVLILRDMTEWHRIQDMVLAAETAVTRAEAEAALLRSERMAQVGQLAASVAHEINNPLTYVITNIEYVRRRQAAVAGGDSLRQALEDAYFGANRVREIVRDLKTFARVDTDEPVPVRVTEVADTSLRMVEAEVRHRARVVKQYEADPYVLASEARLGQVLVNLLVNAAHAIEAGRAADHTITLHVGLDEEGRAVIEVRDTGVGIAEEDLAHVAEPFFTTKPVGVGTGLGLSVSTSLIESFGGTLALDSKLGVGTTARIVLPASSISESKLASARGAEAITSAKVLIVDDDARIVAALESALPDHDVTTVTSGMQALEVLRGDAGASFEVILCDMMMPHMTGIELYQHIEREHPELTKRVVFITGGAFTERARRFLADGHHRVLSKPFYPDQLERTIDEVRRRCA